MNTDVRANKLRERVLELVAAVADPTRGDEVFSNYMRWVSQLYTSYSWANTMLIRVLAPTPPTAPATSAGSGRRQVLRAEGHRSRSDAVRPSGRDPYSRPVIHRPVRGSVGHLRVSQTTGADPGFKVDLGETRPSRCRCRSRRRQASRVIQASWDP